MEYDPRSVVRYDLCTHGYGYESIREFVLNMVICSRYTVQLIIIDRFTQVSYHTRVLYVESH